MGNITENTKITPDLTLLELDASNNMDVLKIMSQHMYDQKVVKESYCNAIEEREKVYPTGLQCEGIAIAIPHTDSEHVLEQSICLATLKNPVSFIQMGTDDQEIEVSIVFMLGIKDPKQQVDFLQQLMVLLEHPEELKKIKATKTKEDACNQFIQSFEAVNRNGD